MSQYRLTPAARADLSQIWDFTANAWGIRQANTYVNELRLAMDRIARNPDIGQPSDQVRTGYCRYAIGRHVLFYTVSPTSVDIIRILHQRMDPTFAVL